LVNTPELIDGGFGQWSMRLAQESSATLPAPYNINKTITTVSKTTVLRPSSQDLIFIQHICLALNSHIM